jgi:fucose 4-O-acetylase-like acetyltransferase
MLCSSLVLSFDACIVTITWYLLFVVIALWVIYQTRQITLAPRSSSGLPTLVCFLIFHRLTRRHLALFADVGSGFKSLSEALCLAWKCGTHRSESPIRAL